MIHGSMLIFLLLDDGDIEDLIPETPSPILKGRSTSPMQTERKLQT